jgi:hypothetical protein
MIGLFIRRLTRSRCKAISPEGDRCVLDADHDHKKATATQWLHVSKRGRGFAWGGDYS